MSDEDDVLPSRVAGRTLGEEVVEGLELDDVERVVVERTGGPEGVVDLLRLET
jgi:hypothetical protein